MTGGNMKRILCYGDSNTHGYNPENGFRFDENTRWPQLLKKALGKNFKVIEEGYNGRTINIDDPEGIMKSGKTYLYPCIRSHTPIDLVILMLGSNDMKIRFQKTAKEIGTGIEELIFIIKKSSKEKHPEGKEADILLLSPLYIKEDMPGSVFADSFGGERAIRISRELPKIYKDIAKKYGIYYLDASKITEVSSIDSLHLDAKGHKKMADKIYQTLCDIYQLQ